MQSKIKKTVWINEKIIYLNIPAPDPIILKCLYQY